MQETLKKTVSSLSNFPGIWGLILNTSLTVAFISSDPRNVKGITWRQKYISSSSSHSLHLTVPNGTQVTSM